MNKNKTDLFEILSLIDLGDKEKYDQIKNDYSPFITMKWLASCKDSSQIILTNNLLNVCIFNLHREKKLLYYLSCCISNGKKKRYNWVTRYKNKDNVKLKLLTNYFSMSNNEAKMGLWKYDKEDYIEMAKELGYSNEELKKVKKQLQ